MKRLLATVLLTVTTTASPLWAETVDISGWSFGTDGTITWNDVEALRRQIFETFDADGDGALNSEEYTNFDHARAAAADADASSLLLRAVSGLGRNNTDANLDGSVSRMEMEDALRAWFTRVDQDNDGVISKGEY